MESLARERVRMSAMLIGRNVCGEIASETTHRGWLQSARDGDDFGFRSNRALPLWPPYNSRGSFCAHARAAAIFRAGGTVDYRVCVSATELRLASSSSSRSPGAP